MTNARAAKGTVGSRIKQVPRGVWNSMVAAGEAHQLRELGSADPQRRPPRRTEFIKLQNATGSARQRGEVLGIGEPLLDTIDQLHPWFSGEPARIEDNHFGFAILADAAADDGVVDAQISGVCLAKVSIRDDGHRWATIATGENAMQSSDTGVAMLLSVPQVASGDAATDPRDCLVLLTGTQPIPIWRTGTNGITTRANNTTGEGVCDAYAIDLDGDFVALTDRQSNPIRATVRNMFQSEIGGERYIQAVEIFGAMVVSADECDG